MIVVGNQEQAQSSTAIVIKELKILLFRSNDTLFHGELYKKNYYIRLSMPRLTDV